MSSHNRHSNSQAETPADYSDEPRGGVQNLPLRGLAMVLIAVAALLALWAIYSMSRTEAANNAASSTTSVTSSAAPASAAPQSPAPAQPSPAEQPKPAESSAAQPPAAPMEEATIHVLNNSTQQGLAAQVAEKLTSNPKYHTGEVGNLANTILPENTVFFNPGDTAAEHEARELATRIGGVARERIPELPQETAGPHSLVVVLVNAPAL